VRQPPKRRNGGRRAKRQHQALALAAARTSTTSKAAPATRGAPGHGRSDAIEAAALAAALAESARPRVRERGTQGGDVGAVHSIAPLRLRRPLRPALRLRWRLRQPARRLARLRICGGRPPPPLGVIPGRARARDVHRRPCQKKSGLLLSVSLSGGS
jgi:hypothetical protein